MCLAEQILLDAIIREHSDVVVVGENSVPAGSNSQALGTFSVFEFIVPLLDILPLIKRLELQVRALAAPLHIIAVHFVISWVLLVAVFV